MTESLLKWTKILAVLIGCGLLLSSTAADPDLFARLSVGKLADVLGYVPLKDPFSFSPKKPVWIDHEWLSGVIFFYVYHFTSDWGLFLFKIGAAFLSLSFLIEAALVKEGRHTFYIFIAALLIAVDSQYVWASTVRSQVFTYIFLSLYLYLINKFEKEKNFRPLFLIPLTMVLWCNMHGGFVVGLGLYSLFVFTRPKIEIFRHLMILGLSIVVTALNPYGFIVYWNYIIEAVTMSRHSISEWQPIPFNDQIVLPVSIMVLALYAMIRQKRSLHVYPAILLSAYFCFSHQRHVALFYFITFAFIPDLLNLKLPFNKEFGEKIKISFVLAMISFILYFSFRFGELVLSPGFELDKSNYPVAALSWLKLNRQGGRVLVDFNNGSYAIWKLYPEFLISLDGRYEELYPESTLRLINEAYSCDKVISANAMSVLKPDFALVSSKVECHQEYRKIYTDDSFAILEIANQSS